MLRVISFLLFFSSLSASASEYKYLCFDVYNLYGNLRYTTFDGTTDFQIVKNLISGGDRGTLSILLKNDQATIVGFDETFFDGNYLLQVNIIGNGFWTYTQTETPDPTAEKSFSLQNYKPSDAPATLAEQSILKGSLNILNLGQQGESFTEVICGLEVSEGKKIEWDPVVTK